jgi:hypothetical protein
MRGLTILEDALQGRTAPRQNFVEYNSVDDQGNPYYDAEAAKRIARVGAEADALGFQEVKNVDMNGPTSEPMDISVFREGDAKDASGNPASKSPTKVQAVKTQSDPDLNRIENQEGTFREMSPEEQTADSMQGLLEEQQAQRNEAKAQQRMLSGGKFFLDVMNSQSAYSSFENASILNIQNQRMQANDALMRGKQRSMQAQQEGRRYSDDALLRMAAQGQDVSGLATESIRSSYEQVAAYNAMEEETNAIREALGYDLQEVAIEYELEQKRIQRDSTIISSALEFGANYWAYS